MIVKCTRPFASKMGMHLPASKPRRVAVMIGSTLASSHPTASNLS